MFIEFNLNANQTDPDFAGLDKFCISQDQIGQFIPLEEGGCKLFLKNGGIVAVAENYKDLRWLADAHTIDEFNHRRTEIASGKGDPYNVNLQGTDLNPVRPDRSGPTIRPPLD